MAQALLSLVACRLLLPLWSLTFPPLLEKPPQIALRRSDDQHPHQEQDGKLPGVFEADDEAGLDVLGALQLILKVRDRFLEIPLKEIQRGRLVAVFQRRKMDAADEQKGRHRLLAHLQLLIKRKALKLRRESRQHDRGPLHQDMAPAHDGIPLVQGGLGEEDRKS